jgi:hypothetical protein
MISGGRRTTVSTGPTRIRMMLALPLAQTIRTNQHAEHIRKMLDFVVNSREPRLGLGIWQCNGTLEQVLGTSRLTHQKLLTLARSTDCPPDA